MYTVNPPLSAPKAGHGGQAAAEQAGVCTWSWQLGTSGEEGSMRVRIVCYVCVEGRGEGGAQPTGVMPGNPPEAAMVSQMLVWTWPQAAGCVISRSACTTHILTALDATHQPAASSPAHLTSSQCSKPRQH